MNGGLRLVARAEFRHRRWAYLALALVIGVGLGASLSAFTAAYRTDRAYPDYLRRAAITDLIVNPSLPTVEFDRAVRALPHVRGVWTEDQLIAGAGDPEKLPRTSGGLATMTDVGEAYGSIDGRYLDADRLIISEGRAPSGPREVFVTTAFRPTLEQQLGRRVTVGSTVPIVFFRPDDVQPDAEGNFDPKRAVEPLAVEDARVSGFGRLPDEVLDDTLFPRNRVIVSGDLTRKYTCLEELGSAGSSLNEVYRRVYPAECARTYRFWALDVDDPTNVPAVTRGIADIAQRLNDARPRVLKEEQQEFQNAPGYYPIITTRADLEAQVDHSVQPSVVAFVLFGLLAGIAALLLGMLGSARLIRQSRTTNHIVETLGMTRRARAGALALPVGLSLALGVMLAVGVGAFGSRAGPAGEVRRVVPNVGLSLPAFVVLPVIGGFVVGMLVTIGIAAWNGARRAEPHGTRRRTVRTRLNSVSPAIGDGGRAALSTRRGGALLTTACCVAVGTLVAAGVFGANLNRLVDDSQRYGWPWDAGVLTNYGYGGTNVTQVAEDLDARADVASYDLLGFANGTVAGENVSVLYTSSAARPVDLPIVEGRAPATSEEAAIGRTTAERLNLAVGDRVPLDLQFGPKEVEIVGIVTLPVVGQYLSDRASLGLGAFTLVPPEAFVDTNVTFVGIAFEPGTDAAGAVASLQPSLQNWDTSELTPHVYSAPIRPADIVNADAMRRAPLVLSLLLAAALITALALSIAATVIARRREFAIYRAIGFTRGQIAQSVRWQALTTVAVGLAIGIPAGVLVGRLGWHLFADDLGVTSSVTLPYGLLAGIAIGAIVVALLAAARPARVASRVPPAVILRTQ